MEKKYLVIFGIVILTLILVGIPVYNRYFRKQVYQVYPGAGWDMNSSVSDSPTSLAQIQAIAKKYNAEVATDTQLATAAAAGAQWPVWGWTMAGTAYVPMFPYAANNASTLASDLSCCSWPAGAFSVNPCLAAAAQTCSSPAGATCSPPSSISYDSTKGTATYNGGTMSCTSAGVIANVEFPSGTSYVYTTTDTTAMMGVTLYGVKPQEGSDSTVQPFNATSYSQYGLFSL